MDTNSRITIDGFTGGPEGSDLKECYFQETAEGSGEFLLFCQDQSQIHTHPKTIQNGVQFTFKHRNLSWTAAFVYLDTIGVGAGIWSALPAVHARKAGKDPEDPESGTFQAQNGPGAGGQLESSASASA